LSDRQNAGNFIIGIPVCSINRRIVVSLGIASGRSPWISASAAVRAFLAASIRADSAAIADPAAILARGLFTSIHR
jgi:hypothetical protein